MKSSNGGSGREGAAKWAGKVTVGELTEPWWQTQAIQAVARVNVAGVLEFDAHVVRGNAGKPFVAMPSSKHGETWEPVIVLADSELRAEVTKQVLAAFEEWGAPAQVADARAGLPF